MSLFRKEENRILPHGISVNTLLDIKKRQSNRQYSLFPILFLDISLQNLYSCYLQLNNMNFKSTLCCVLLISIAQEILGKQQLNKKQMFGSKSLRCLVCKALVEEVNYVIDSTSPTKKTTTREKDIRNNYEVVKIPYKRSQEQLTDIVESICSHFEDYVQAQSKADKSPAVIRLTTRTGNGMNPDFGNYDVVPDEDLNTRLKFYAM
ncbi:CNPY1_2 [Lepeophtheirus salmonis]|uniref:CNPY1_2 n=1 Tax=Lepeophtheirus salmonis TaxID=72036 RepID=A0A7R8CK39_LEPSM|nr:CNPY1_2 [Lepeophtheirus salmonis]CAF2843878.1 CNPY1_2 [Lepeophtheirus salmonis]